MNTCAHKQRAHGMCSRAHTRTLSHTQPPAGKAKLDILQSKLLNKAAHTHSGTAKSIQKEKEKKQEAVERLRQKEERAETKVCCVSWGWERRLWRGR